MKLPLYSIEEIKSGKKIKVSANMKWSALNLWILKSIIILTYPILIYLHPYFACISLCRLKWYIQYTTLKAAFAAAWTCHTFDFTYWRFKMQVLKISNFHKLLKTQARFFFEMDGGSAAGHEKIVRQKFKTICTTYQKKFFMGKCLQTWWVVFKNRWSSLKKFFKTFF